MVRKMAIVLLPPFFLPNRSGNCKSDSVGMANLAKLCQTISSSEARAFSGRQAMSRKECWSRPIAVLDGKERHALRVLPAFKSGPYAHSQLHRRVFHVTHGCFVILAYMSEHHRSSIHVSILGHSAPLHTADLQ